MHHHDLTSREETILLHVVRSFIDDGEPVASGAVARSGVVDVSSATIRNVMAELEQKGLLTQPHTSAGRVPTLMAMRYYVDVIAAGYDKTSHGAEASLNQLRDRPPSEVVRLAGSMLSEMTHLAGIVLGPRLERVRLRDVRIVALRPEKLLAVVVTEDGRALERIVVLDEPVDPLTLTRSQNFLSDFVKGRTLRELRERVRHELAEAQSTYHDFVKTALTVSARVAEDEMTTDVHVEGHLNLLEHDDVGSDSERVRELLRALDDRENLVRILDALCEARRPVTLIGPEVGGTLGDGFSLVICGYYRGLEQAGLVGILGPVRMNYARMIPLVDRTARMLSRELVIGA